MAWYPPAATLALECLHSYPLSYFTFQSLCCYMCVNTCMCVRMCVCGDMHVCGGIHVCGGMYICRCIYVGACMYIGVYMFVGACTCIHMEKQRLC